MSTKIVLQIFFLINIVALTGILIYLDFRPTPNNPLFTMPFYFVLLFLFKKIVKLMNLENIGIAITRVHRLVIYLNMVCTFKYFRLDDYFGIKLRIEALFFSFCFFGIVDFMRSYFYETTKKALSHSLFLNYNMLLLEFSEKAYEELRKNRIKSLKKKRLLKKMLECLSFDFLGEEDLFRKRSKEFLKKKPKNLDSDKLFDIWKGHCATIAFSSHTENIVDLKFLPDKLKDEKNFKERLNTNLQTSEFTAMDDKMGEELVKYEKNINKKYKSNKLKIKKLKDCNCQDVNDPCHEKTFNEPINLKEREFITIKSLENSFGNRSEEMYKFLAIKEFIPISRERFRENIRQINNERTNFYLNLTSQKKLISLLNQILVFIETSLVTICFFYVFSLDTVYIKLPLPFLLMCVFPSLFTAGDNFCSIIFSHPYDCGDRIYIGGINYIVRKTGLFSTVLDKWNGQRIIVSNKLLSSLVIGNAKRSAEQKGCINIYVTSSTPIYRLNTFNARITEAAKSNFFFKKIFLEVNHIDDCNLINLNVVFTHNDNFQNGFFMWKRHTAFVKVVKNILTDLDIKYVPVALNIDIEKSVKV